LARAQAMEVVSALRTSFPEVDFRHRVLMTTGDRDRRTRFSVLGGDYEGAFAKQLELALLDREIDVAVHSLKDLPTRLPSGLTLAAVPAREDVHDALCGARLDELAPGARVGTGAPRRQAQLLHVRPDLRMVAMRGNLPPRLGRLRSSSPLDAVVLAVAGLRRLGLEDQITELLPIEQFPPAAGQGALAVEIREDDDEVNELVKVVDEPMTRFAVDAERALLHELHGGCTVPVGAYGRLDRGVFRLRAQVTSLDGTQQVDRELVAEKDSALAAGRALARTMLDAGAGEILEGIRPSPR
jgi:hydroxymethylbilane synthase